VSLARQQADTPSQQTELSKEHSIQSDKGGHEILEHCRDTQKLVSQMASVLRGLEADMGSLRQENRDLRVSMFVTQQAQHVSHLPQMSPQPSPQSSPPLPNLLDSLWQEASQVEPQQQQQQQRAPQLQQADEPVPLSARLVQPAAEAAHCQQLDRPLVIEASQLSAPEASILVSPVHERRPPRPATDRPCGSLADPQWSLDQSFWLGGVCPTQVPGKARVIDRESMASVTLALDGLNRGTLRCPENACIVFSTSNQRYFLLYRLGHKTDVCNIALKLGAKSVEDGGFHRQSPANGDAQSATPLPPMSLQQTHLQQHAQLMQQQQQQQQQQLQGSISTLLHQQMSVGWTCRW